MCSECVFNSVFFSQDGWEKRYAFLRLLVELLSSASQQKNTQSTSYADIITFLMQTVLDIVVFGKCVHNIGFITSLSVLWFRNNILCHKSKYM